MHKGRPYGPAQYAWFPRAPSNVCGHVVTVAVTITAIFNFLPERCTAL
jgi:hypothetical protein